MWPFKRKKKKIFQQNDLLDLEARMGPRKRQQLRSVLSALGVAMGVAIVGGSLWWGSEIVYREWVLQNKALSLKRLEIRNNGLIPAAQLQRWAGVREGDNLLALDLYQIKRNLELIPLIENAAIERLFPDTLRIHVTERKPVAQVRAFVSRAGGFVPELFYVDRFGYVLMPLQEQARAWTELGESIPFISGLNAELLRPGRQITAIEMRATLELIERFAATRMAKVDAISNIDLGEKHVLRVTVSSGAEVAFALKDIPTQLARWRAVQAYGRQRQLDLASLDLAITNYVPVRWAPPEDAAETNKPAATAAPIRKRNV